MTKSTDAYIIFGFAALVFGLLFVAIRFAVINSLKSAPQQDRSAYTRTLQNQKRHMDQIEESHASMKEQQERRIEDLQNMQESSSLQAEDLQSRQREAMRAQKQRIKDMQQLHN